MKADLITPATRTRRFLKVIQKRHDLSTEELVEILDYEKQLLRGIGVTKESCN